MKVPQLDVSKFETTKVTNMEHMLGGCYGITELDLSNFQTSNVTNMNRMFESSNKLTSLDLSTFDTSKVTLMHGMFNGCSKLEKLNLANFQIQDGVDTENFFGTETEGSVPVPTTVQIQTNETMATWLRNQYPTYTNIQT